MENILNAIMKKLEGIEGRLGVMDDRLGVMDEKLDKLETGQTVIRNEVAAIKEDVTMMNTKFDSVAEEMEALVVSYGKITQRVTVLDNRYAKDQTRQNKDLS